MSDDGPGWQVEGFGVVCESGASFLCVHSSLILWWYKQALPSEWEVQRKTVLRLYSKRNVGYGTLSWS
jgi:hypothetical protein